MVAADRERSISDFVGINIRQQTVLFRRKETTVRCT